MRRNYYSIDFEFYNANERNLCVVCASIKDEQENKIKNFWLETPEEKKIFVFYIESLKAPTFLCYSAIAEGRAFLSLGLNPLKYEWIDLMVEYKMIINKDNKLSYGKQLIRGKEVVTEPPTLYDDKNNRKEKTNSSRPEVSLASSTYKLLDKKIDSKRKTKMRNVILSRNKLKIKFYKKEIMDYCESDIMHLRPLQQNIIKEFVRKNKTIGNYILESIERGEYSVACAFIETNGYPVMEDELKYLIECAPSLVKHKCIEINKLFPEILPFEYDKKTRRFCKKVKKITKWCEKYEKEKKKVLFDRTEKENISISSESFERVFKRKHEYPTDCFGSQFLGYLHFISTLAGIVPPNVKKKKSIINDLGSDGRIRCFSNPFGASSGRNQPPSTSFIPLKSAWSRYLIQPTRGRCLVSADYASQEFYIAGLESQDRAMVKSYESGDPYLYTGKACGKIPRDATKESHYEMRNKFKSTTLGVQYGMGATSLSRKIALDTGEECTEDEAQDLIDMFFEVYSDYEDFLEYTVERYYFSGILKAKGNWYMWGDNPNSRSIKNFKIQGAGAGVLRKAVVQSVKSGLNVVYSLHDAIVIECEEKDWKICTAKLLDIMRESFIHYYPRGTKLRLDASAWSPDFKKKETLNIKDVKVDLFKFYIDPRGYEEYKKNKKLLENLKGSEII